MRSLPVIVSLAALAAGVLYLHPTTGSESRSSVPSSLDTASAARLLNRQPGFFVPNLGQWKHPAKFVHRSGPMTLFVEERGWFLDLAERSTRPVVDPTRPEPMDDRDTDQESRGVALRMTFEGDAYAPEIVGEKKLGGHHNYFLGSDESRWRTGVPLYGSVRYENLYPGIDLRLREANGVPEYDLLLQPGADLSLVAVHVEGGQRLSIARDGSLVIETALGPVTQSMPKTWQVDGDGRKHEVVCNFTLLGAGRFGFAAPSWVGDTSLTIDPGLVWSTYLGAGVGGAGAGSMDIGRAVSVDASGMVTVAGGTWSPKFPTTSGAFDTTHNVHFDVFVSRFDPSKAGTAQLVYSTFLGGNSIDDALAVSVDAMGVVTVAGYTYSPNLPTTNGAYDTTFNGGVIVPIDGFISRLDPNMTGAAQLVYSTFLGGKGRDLALAMAVDASGVVTVAGYTHSTDFPTTPGAYDTTLSGNINYPYDVFVTRLIPLNIGRAGLVYSTFLGGGRGEWANSLSVDARGVMTVAGETISADFPMTSGAVDTTYMAGEAFVSRLDPSKTGAAQLVYSTFLGGSSNDYAHAVFADALGVVTVAGLTRSSDHPITSGAYDTTYNGGRWGGDAFVSRLDPSKTGAAQLLYSTYLGGNYGDQAWAVSAELSGVVTVTGWTGSLDFPTTAGAYSTTHNGGYDAFVSRLDPRKTGTAQLVYSTFLGGAYGDKARALFVDASGAVIVAGETSSTDFPTTSGAYDTTHNGGTDVFASRLSMGVALYGDVHAISITTGGTQKLTVNAGKAHANRLYWIFGSESGTSPGVDVLGVHIPLNPDLYTIIAMSAVNGKEFTKFRGTLDANGLATASFNVPAKLPFPPGFTFHHAYVVYGGGRFYMASNPVPLRLR